MSGLVGHTEPRVFTPPLRELTPETTLGFECVEFAEKALGVDLYPWQRWLLIHMLELRPDGLFRFRKVVVLVARQNGKSTLSQVLALYFMYVLRAPKVLGTAQDLTTSEDVWAGALELAQESDVLAPLLGRPKYGKGSKEFSLTSGELYRVRAANRRAGRGLSKCRLVLLDELREHQSWDAWAAVTKTTNAEREAIVLALSNAGDVTSVVLRYLRKMAHLALGDPDGINAADDPTMLLEDAGVDSEAIEVEADDSLGIFEWSASPGRAVQDRSGWQEANPSLGRSITERVLLSDARTDPEWVFRTECLCEWSDGALVGPFPPGAWDAGRESVSGLSADAPVSLCVTVSWDRSTSHVSLAGRRDDDLMWVETIATRVGTEWLIPWLTSPDRQERVRAAPVVMQANGAPESSLIDSFREAGINVVEWKGADLTIATGLFYDAVREKQVLHGPWPALDVAAATAIPRVLEGGAFMWDLRRSPVDAAPLKGVTGAAWHASIRVDYDPLAYIF